MESENIIYWPTNIPINPSELESDIKFVRKNIAGLIPIYREEMSKLKLYAINRDVSIHMILSIRNQIKIQMEIKSSRYSIDENKIINKFNELIQIITPNLEQIINFYAKLMYPPPIVMKIISKLPSFKELDHDLTKKFYQIFKDINKIEHKSKILSEKFEHILENFISNHHINFLTEMDIRNGQISHLTPDILFEQPVIINVNGINQKIRWIDAKNFIFMGPYIPFMHKKIIRQAEKYNKEFGQGAFVFKYGFIDGINIDGAYLLDGSKLT